MAQTLSYLTIKTKQILFCSLKKGFRFDMINANFWTKTRKYDYNVFIKFTLLFIRVSKFNNAEYMNIIVRLFDEENKESPYNAINIQPMYFHFMVLKCFV